MIEDAESRTDDWFKDRTFDVCIIGSGPAGITLARRLGASGASVGLFEAGGLEFSADSQALYQGVTEGAPQYYPLDGARLRYFGGSSNHWGGWTRPLDAYDFEPKPHHPLSGWPIAKTDLDPYGPEADAILILPEDAPAPDVMPAAADLVARRFRFSRPIVHFGEKYRAELEASKNIRVVLNANLVDLRLDGGLRGVGEAVFRSYARPEPFSVKARLFALCLGGIENPRALLNCSSQIRTGIGNEHDLVGRYFLEHPHSPAGRIVVRDPLTWMLVYSPTLALMQREKILNFGVRIGDFDQWNAIEFMGALKPQPACNVDFDALLAAAMKGEPPLCPAHVGDVFIACEQSLEPTNRVSLLPERDRFGWRKAKLHWQLSGMDLRTLRTGIETVAERLAEHDAGRIEIADWLLGDGMPSADQLWGGNHHMGTTRMSDDPATGVVDRNVKVHALDNLYVGGSSVFATSGHANPTYTIVQLALRLGDHLKERLRAG